MSDYFTTPSLMLYLETSGTWQRKSRTNIKRKRKRKETNEQSAITKGI
jgi:hypothetical protein